MASLQDRVRQGLEALSPQQWQALTTQMFVKYLNTDGDGSRKLFDEYRGSAIERLTNHSEDMLQALQDCIATVAAKPPMPDEPVAVAGGSPQPTGRR